MYGSGNASGLSAALPTAAGVVVLPNTGDNHVLFFVALASVIIGSVIVITTIIRMIAKRVYRA